MAISRWRVASTAILWAAAVVTGCKRQTEGPVSAAATPATDTARMATPQTQNSRGFEGCKIGTKLSPDGDVAEVKNSFAANEPIHFTLGAPQVAPSLQITLQILDSNGDEVKSLFKSMDNEKMVTFPLRNLGVGRYTAKGFWGDQKICEVAFEIR